MSVRAAALWTAAGLFAAACWLLPICNPDLFWHLSAGRWILEHRALPRADWLSFTAAARPWVDFEWLAQLVFQAAYAAGGMAALRLLKAAMLAAAWLPLDRALARRGCGPAPRALGLLLWSAGMLGNSDIRPELFSLVFFNALIYLGETGRLENTRPRVLALIGCLFALWSNFHGAFPAGWFLLFCYALQSGRTRRWASFIVAIPATWLNPYGLGPWRVILRHILQSRALSRTILEWQGLGYANPLHWPLWALLGLAAFTLAAAARRRALRPLAIATLAFGLATLGHERNSAYFAACAAVLLPLLWRGLEWQRRIWFRRTAAAAVLAYAVFWLWLAPKAAWGAAFNGIYVPRAAAGFMAGERPALEPLRLYNQWEWGGYLGWRLRPWYRVFCDGRYIFHDLLVRTGPALAGPQAWQNFLDAGRLDGGLMLNRDVMLPARKLYPDGTLKNFPRPWYYFYMPPSRWALVYWDRQSLLFVDRKAVGTAWLTAHEYKYARPHDEAALREALRLKEIPIGAAAAEAERHARETRGF